MVKTRVRTLDEFWNEETKSEYVIMARLLKLNHGKIRTIPVPG